MPAKTVTKTTKTAKASSPSKTGKVRLSEADKAEDTTKYILNPATNKHVLITSATGKKVVKAKEAGETVKKTLTKGPFAIAIIQALMAHVSELTDDVVKSAIADADIDLPRSFPKAWGGSGKSTDSGKPKRAVSAYNWFVKLVGPKLKEENPEGNMMEMVAAAWKDITPSGKKKYEAMAAEDKIRNAKECEERGIAVSPTTKRPAKTNGWRVYSAEQKPIVTAKNPDLSKGEVSKKVAAEWHTMTEEDKALYSATADEQNEDINERIEAWQKENPGAVTRSKTSPGPKPKKPISEMSPAEQKKAKDPKTYIYNPSSGRHVKLDSKKGKEIAKNKKSDEDEDEDVVETQDVDDDDVSIADDGEFFDEDDE